MQNATECQLEFSSKERKKEPSQNANYYAQWGQHYSFHDPV